jgi:hypothetical protein
MDSRLFKINVSNVKAMAKTPSPKDSIPERWVLSEIEADCHFCNKDVLLWLQKN